LRICKGTIVKLSKMSKKEIPKIVTEVLKEVPETIK